MYLVLLAQLHQRDAADRDAKISRFSLLEDGHVVALTLLAAAKASVEHHVACLKCDSRHSQGEAHMVSWCHSEKRSSQNKQGMPAGQSVSPGWQLMHQAGTACGGWQCSKVRLTWMRQDVCVSKPCVAMGERPVPGSAACKQGSEHGAIRH